MAPSTCPCGSGEYCWALNDARGIFCSFVCAMCEAEVKSGFRPEIFSDGNYETDEDIEPEDGDITGPY